MNERKLFHSTREVCAMLGIPPHTLRYRATRAGIRVLRTSGNHGRRLFRAGDIERLSQVASLLKEGYRLDGARRRIEAPLPDRRALSSLRLELVRLKGGFSTTGIRRDP